MSILSDLEKLRAAALRDIKRIVELCIESKVLCDEEMYNEIDGVLDDVIIDAAVESRKQR